MEKAINDFEKLLGVRAIFGGYHTTQGTKNALINLNDGCYLELLAADDTNKTVRQPRWMGIDLLTKPQTTRWALKSDTLDCDRAILTKYKSAMGMVTAGSRSIANGSLLKWELVMPLPQPEVEIVPFAIDWSATETHPCNELPDMGCELIELYATHSNPDFFEKIFQLLNFNLRIEKTKNTSLKTVIKCPNGIIEI